VRFLCDEMLVRLGRWLRAAGHDTMIAEPGAADADLVSRAGHEQRILLTRDRALPRQADGGLAILLLPDRVVDQALMLRRVLGLDWLAAPFTRCLVDNHLLVASEPGDAIPETARALPGPFRRCPSCGREYWPGSHVRRMTARLAAWNADLPAQPSGQAAR